MFHENVGKLQEKWVKWPFNSPDLYPMKKMITFLLMHHINNDLKKIYITSETFDIKNYKNL